MYKLSGRSSPLLDLKKQLQSLAQKPFPEKYLVPALWVKPGNEIKDGQKPLEVHPGEYYLEHIEAIEENGCFDVNPMCSLNSQLSPGTSGSWIADESIFNIFVRLTTAYDHDGDGILGGDSNDLTLNKDGVRESGTFLKAIAMLGYIKTLGFTTIHLLPVTAIGHDGNKGELGSPYAIKDPYKIEESLADPLLNMTVEEQFKAFVQASHILGIRVIAEFVFRTASKDSDWILKHPDWFYWIDEQVEDRTPGETDLVKATSRYGNPIFNSDELAVINQKIAVGDLTKLPPPPPHYKSFFKLSPAIETVKLTDLKQIRGEGLDPESKKLVKLRIPGAFADWPPDDNQPPWGDVTYLKMYIDENCDKPEFNYIAYNTIRMYDKKLARPELINTTLWETIINLVPYYQQEYGIDGVMVDMGHAMPVTLMQNIIRSARDIDPDFAFLSENFEIKQDSVDAGYNAVVGYAWWVEYRREGMYNLLNHVGNEGVPLPFFGAVENHNTPRAAGRVGGEVYSKYAFLVNTLLPNSIPFLHSGQELGEVIPVNTGLDFTNENIESLKDFKLALFDLCGYKWDGEHKMLDFTKRVMNIRKDNADIISQKDRESFCNLQTGEADVICFLRRKADKHIMVLFNRELSNTLSGQIELDWCLSPNFVELENLLGDDFNAKVFKVEGQKLEYRLKPGECACFIWEA